MHILAIDASPTGPGRTSIALRAIADAAAGSSGFVEELSVATGDVSLDRIEAADALVLGSPVYRATLAWPMKRFLDGLPRGLFGEGENPLSSRPVAIAFTGATLHHFKALDDLRAILATFFAAHVVPPGVYVPRDGFADDELAEPYLSAARAAGAALAEYAQFLVSSEHARRLAPQA